ncbi:hypothetical protein U0070_016889 [Myodes glareolus]|uniref:Protein CUSTOS n=1 Tax=Myodes glareolus TaxID=447135 RepID=A0AAW0IBQ9_MYOGA
MQHLKMVASSGAMSDSESGSSSNSDAEELERCREAAMPAWGLEQRPQWAEKPRTDAAGKQVPASQPSHSSIAVSEVWKKPCKAEVQPVAEAEDGFRLFFTSIPGGHKKEASPKPCRKRQPPSSSSDDSDEEWQRCREAAVSASDILQESAIHCPAEVEEEADKKKLKKKAKKKADIDLARATGLNQVKEAGSVNGDPASLGTKKKKKKKKAKKAREASPCAPAECAAAGPED